MSVMRRGSDAEMRRLCFVRYLYRLSVAQSDQPEPLCAAAILVAHDAVELFLQIAAEKLDVGLKTKEFMDYWPAIAPRLKPPVLSHQQAMKRLNRARVALKHHGIFPARLEVDSLLQSAESFLAESCGRIFDVEFAAVSLVALVTEDAVRSNLEAAVVALENCDTRGVLECAAVAMAWLLRPFEVEVPHDFELDRISRLGGGGSFGSIQGHARVDPVVSPALARDLQGLVGAVRSLREGLATVRLGIDERDLARFRRLTPVVTIFQSGEYGVAWSSPDAFRATADDARSCIDFVTETALRLQLRTPAAGTLRVAD